VLTTNRHEIDVNCLNDEIRMTKLEGMTNDRMTKVVMEFFRHSGFVLSFVIPCACFVIG
jgi:hypothetical protein